nr:reverse transcriptase domain-containing protein [Tanacetum cinerariifolium]
VLPTKNKSARKVEDHPRNLNKRNNVNSSLNDKRFGSIKNVVCGACNKYLVSFTHDKCYVRSVNTMHAKKPQVARPKTIPKNVRKTDITIAYRIVPQWKPTGRQFILCDIYGPKKSKAPTAKPLVSFIMMIRRRKFNTAFKISADLHNPGSTSEPIIFDSSPSLTLFEGSDFIFEEIEAYLKDESISPEINHADCDPEGDICLIEKLLNDDPFQLPPMDLKQGEVIKEKSLIEEPSKLELKDLPSHLEYAYLEGVDKFPMIIAKDLKDDEKEALLKVDRAKVDVIAKLPHPTTVKCIRSFLGHAGFYRRFIQDFSKIARPMTHLLEKETPFVFSKDCIDAFETLKKKLTEAPILVVPDWNLPFELMCDASDFVIGVVLGQRMTKHFQPIHYASKTMTEAQIHYTTTEKEMLAVVYAFEKFRPYPVLLKA